MTAQVKEVVTDADLLKLEDLRPDVSENCFTKKEISVRKFTTLVLGAPLPETFLIWRENLSARSRDIRGRDENRAVGWR